MKQQVDNLIANTLLDEGELYLPEIGTLILYRHTAKLLSKRELQRPYRELRLTKEQRGVNLLSHISAITGVSAERASDIYTEWLSQSLRNNILKINGLCVIEDNNITTDKTFEDMANPKGRGAVKVNPRTNYFIYIVAVLCMAFALGVAGYVLYMNGVFNLDKGMTAVEKVAVEQPIEVVEQPTEELVQPVVDSLVVVAEPAASVAEEASSSLAPLRKGMSYAVYGVYNELRNAEEALARLASNHPDIEAHIYDYDGRYMVALYELPQRTACGRKVSALKAERSGFKSVWVYTR